MAELNKEAMSTFPRELNPQDNSTLIALNGGINVQIPLQALYAFLGSKFIPQSEKNVINGVPTLDENGKIRKIQLPELDLNIQIEPINLSTPTPTQNGVFEPIEAGVYTNFGGIEITNEDINNSITYIYYYDGVFTKQSKSVIAVDKVEPFNQNAVTSNAVYYWSVRNVSTIDELRTIKGYEGQKINLLGYYEAGDKPSLLYEWVEEEREDDGGGTISVGNGCWNALFGDSSVDIRDYGVRMDTDKDQSNLVQKFFDTCRKVYLPNGYVFINPNINNDFGIICRSNTFVFSDNFTFKAMPTSTGNSCVFSFKSSENCKLYGDLNLIGEKNSHTGTFGEWGMGLKISSSKNIDLDTLNISECWGDGVYVGEDDSGVTSMNINIDNLFIRDCRRQGMSVITADGLNIKNIDIQDIKGTAPQTGIDFEPNNKNNKLKNIVIDSFKCINTESSSLLFALNKLESTSDDVDIYIKNIIADQRIAFVGGVNTLSNGLIRLGSVMVYDSIFDAIRFENYVNRPNVLIEELNIKNTNRGNSSGIPGSCLIVRDTVDLSSRTSTPFININNLNVIFDKDESKPYRVVYLEGFNREYISNFKIKSSINITGVPSNNLATAYSFDFLPKTYNNIVRDQSVNMDLANYYYCDLITNKNSTNDIDLILYGHKKGLTRKIQVVDEKWVKIRFVSNTGSIPTFEISGNQYIRSNTVGSYIIIECMNESTNQWVVNEINGVWEDNNGNKFSNITKMST